MIRMLVLQVVGALAIGAIDWRNRNEPLPEVRADMLR